MCIILVSPDKGSFISYMPVFIPFTFLLHCSQTQRWNMMFPAGFLWLPFIRPRKFPSLSNYPGVFIMNGCWISSNAYSVYIERTYDNVPFSNPGIGYLYHNYFSQSILLKILVILLIFGFIDLFYCIGFLFHRFLLSIISLFSSFLYV